MKNRRSRKAVQYPVHHDRVRAIAYREKSPERSLAGHPGLIAFVITAVLGWLLAAVLTSIDVVNVSIGSWALFG